ncbi:Dabb family protein [Actinomycetospora atypica]|uniref:Dabb family protein n=1 Tax=Actinomycetospora atypica TaxID=1290095 RepID=A0ABV9YS55_9PSEU
MLMHCLTVRFADSASPAQIDAFRSALAALPDQIDTIVATRQGSDLGERATNAHFALVSEFADVDDFRAYLEHPAHRAVPRDGVESFQSVQFVVDK